MQVIYKAFEGPVLGVLEGLEAAEIAVWKQLRSDEDFEAVVVVL